MILGMLIGFLIAVAAGAIGHFQGYLMGVKVRNLTALVMSPEATITQSKTTCCCGHGVHTHARRGRGSCGVYTRPGYVCACKFFVGVDVKPPKPKKALLDLS